MLATIAAGAEARVTLNRAANELASDPEAARALDPNAFASLVKMESGGQLTATQAKQVLAELLAAGGGDPADIAAAKGFEAMEAGALEQVVDGIIAANPDAWERLKGGDGKVTGFFVGEVMKATKGKANGKEVTALLRERAAAG